MKDQIPTLSMIAALAMVLAALVTLSLLGKGPEGPVVIGLVGAVGTIVGVIGGFSQPNKSAPTPPGMTSQETRTVVATPPDAGDPPAA